MTLPSTPPISFAQIATELGIADSALNITQANARNLAGKPSGTVAIADFYGKSAAMTVNIGGNQGAEDNSPPHGFSLSATVTGGTGPYTYAWSVIATSGTGSYSWTSTTAQTTTIGLSPGVPSSPYQVTVQCVVTDSHSVAATSNAATLTYVSP